MFDNRITEEYILYTQVVTFPQIRTKIKIIAVSIVVLYLIEIISVTILSTIQKDGSSSFSQRLKRNVLPSIANGRKAISVINVIFCSAEAPEMAR